MKIGSFKIIDTQSRVAAGHELIIIPLFLPRAALLAAQPDRPGDRQTRAGTWQLATRNFYWQLASGKNEVR